MRLILEFASAAEVANAASEIDGKGGILVQVSSANTVLGQPIQVTLRSPSGEVTVDGSIIQALGDHGVAIRFETKALEKVTGGVAATGQGASPKNASWADGASSSPEPAKETAGPIARRPQAARASDVPIRERLKTATKAEKIQIALHGSKPERNLILRDRDKSLHQYVIRNPKLGLDEVASIARMSTISADVLGFIVGKREWFQRPEVAAALVRNPKVSAASAKKLLAHISPQELRQLAKGNGVREAIAREARRRLLRK